MEWVRLRDIGKIVTGNTPPTSKPEFYGDYMPFIKATDISLDSKTTLVTEQSYSKRASEKYKESLVPKGSTCVVTIGSIGKKMTYAHKDLFVNQAINAIIPSPKYDNEYIYYNVKYSVLPQLKKLDSGTTSGRENVSKSSFSNIRIPIVKDKNIQHRIASILSTYDSLIENNTKRIRLLEKMAENLYKEWFSYGKIIKGGTIVRLTDIIQITRGLSYSTAEIDCEEGLDLINLKNIQAYGGFRYDGTKKFCGKYKNEQIVCEGDLVMGVTDMTQDRRTVGSVALIPKTDKLSVISADLIKISSSISSVFLFGMFKYGNVSKYVAQFANGANVLHLRPKALHNIKVLLPNPNLINKYVDIVSPMVAEMNKLYVLSEKLARQRDLLLPRLMSGKLEVKEELLE